MKRHNREIRFTANALAFIAWLRWHLSRTRPGCHKSTIKTKIRPTIGLKIWNGAILVITTIMGPEHTKQVFPGQRLLNS